jgi:hypothetical protein
VVGIDFLAEGLISPENALAVRTGSAQAARNQVKGRTLIPGLSDE